jgi:hypothetical protein
MPQENRRTMMRFLGGAALSAAILPALPFQASAQQEDLVVATSYQNFKRGEIVSLDPKTRGLVVVIDGNRVKMKAGDTVVKTTTGYPGNAYTELQEKQTVDVHWFDYLDFLVAKTTPAATAHAKAMVAQGARIEGLPGSDHKVRLFTMTGMVVKVDPASGTVDIINASSGEPDAPSPNSGEVIRLPQIKTAAGLAALKTMNPGDQLTVVYSVQTAFTIAIIR